MMDKPLVNVLLSTYNGPDYLKSQIDSVLNQRSVNVLLTIRDDGSSDRKTRETLTIYEADPRVRLGFGQNLGVTASFYELMRNAETADFYAFCDQDDVWLEDKLARATTRLAEYPDTPALYCCRKIYTDPDLNVLGLSFLCTKPVLPANAAVENIATGCTAVINPELFALALKTSSLKGIFIHDWWICLLASVFGSVIFDEKPSIYYRQHDRNVVGVTPNYFLNSLQRLKRVLIAKRKGEVHWLTQARAFRSQYNDLMTAEQIGFFETLEKYDSGIMDRLTLMFGQHAPYMQRLIDTVILRIMLLFHLF